MGKHHTKAFRQMAVERMSSCDNIGELARELGVHRRLLYKWRERWQPLESSPGSCGEKDWDAKLRQENRQLKQALADKTLEVDFFQGALQKIEARRQRSGNSGETTSTSKSGR